MIDPFWGEFLTNPIPLDLALNYCSHKCGFCFANLNSPERTADVPKIERLLRDYEGRISLQARLLQQGYPVLLSNRVDPFANSNYKTTLPLLEAMARDCIPVALQTRGGRGIDEALAILDPSCWYISICQADDGLRRKVEPGAPSLDSRYELIRRLRAAGHRVVAALNPLVPEWLPDPAPVLERLLEAGAEGVWVETLHLSTDQIGRMTNREREATGAPLLHLSRKRRAPEPWAAHKALTMGLADEMGLPPFSAGYHLPTAFWEPYEATYPTLFPYLQAWVNQCHAELDEGAVLSFDDFASWACDLLPDPDEPGNLTHYIGATAREVVRGMPSAISYRDVLRTIWREPRMPGCPARLRCFAYAGKRDGSGWVEWRDDEGLPLLTFTKDARGFDDYYAEVAQAA